MTDSRRGYWMLEIKWDNFGVYIRGGIVTMRKCIGV